MRKHIIIFILCLILFSCSRPTQFLVKRVIDAQTIELEDGTLVKLIGVNSTTVKYVNALRGLENNYVILYDENYDPIQEITQGNLNAYVYDLNEECINDMAQGGDGGEAVSNQINKKDETVDVIQNNDPPKERISGKDVKALPNSTLAEMYEQNKYAVFLIAVPQSESTYAQGTGFFITSSGIGVSNYHVFEGGDYKKAIIKTIDNHQYRVKSILKSNKELDFIVFEVENNHFDFPFLNIANKTTNVGEDVFAIGNPKGLEHTLSKGIVSSYRKKYNLIQTTAEITHGSSGGPLFNMQGEVIGITTSGVGEANLNFAMNIQKLGINEIIK